ncbi:MAG: hypothetical protein ATN35_03020 [Epulopiscium sp. Nele67-Bin004]|nr:MAG: hypothetical protein ATN35_03020 [Epulopiscium sp. Nele67-Bin004]
MKMDLGTSALLALLLLANKSKRNDEVTPFAEDKDYVNSSGVILSIEDIKNSTVILPELFIPIYEHDSIIDITYRALRTEKIPFEIRGIGREASISMIDGSLQNIANAWLYAIDGEFPVVPPGIYYPKGGEKIQWVFTSSEGPVFNLDTDYFTKKMNNLINLS